ncbi:MAG: hypothetical protein ABI761_06940 [Saprospiraceae bacterium]
MEDLDLINLWKSYDKKLEENLRLNRKNAEDITKIKVTYLLSSMKPIKIFTILVGIIWIGIIDTLIINLFSFASIFFLVSAIALSLLNKLALGIYIFQLILISRVRISEPVLSAQEKLASLKSSTLWIARILFLQLPLWTTFYWNKSMMNNGNTFLWTIQILVTLVASYCSVWLFRNIRYENKNKKWFSLIFAGGEWSPVIRSIEFLNELGQFKKEEDSAYLERL